MNLSNAFMTAILLSLRDQTSSACGNCQSSIDSILYYENWSDFQCQKILFAMLHLDLIVVWSGKTICFGDVVN